uniref:RING-type domain-containing protein n=1 Tax=Opuntia streptacantha TaxID=393608 RepID=A0A7C8YIF1_OPUST
MISLPRHVLRLWNCMQIRGFGFHLALKILETVALVTGTFIFAFGGVIIGGIAGAMKGQTTETGFFRGAAIGVISGSIVALELFDSFIKGHFLSKFALFGSIFDGKAFREWVSPAVLKAYQWQTTSDNDGNNNNEGPRSDIYSMEELRGMTTELINELPVLIFHFDPSTPTVSCTICLQELVEGERARKLPECEQHVFHLRCIDAWLARSASCPVCRKRLDHHSPAITRQN